MSVSKMTDPRLLLQWYRLAIPNRGPIVITPFDAAREKSGLGVQDGVVSYRDGLGRVGQVSKDLFTAHSKALSRDEAREVLPALAPDLSVLRFPLLAQRAERERLREENASKNQRRPLPKKGASRPAARRDTAKSAAAPVVVVKKSKPVIKPPSA